MVGFVSTKSSIVVVLAPIDAQGVNDLCLCFISFGPLFLSFLSLQSGLISLFLLAIELRVFFLYWNILTDVGDAH